MSRAAQEWQRFGRYATQVMHTEVDRVHGQLSKLEAAQTSLMEENSCLREMCLLWQLRQVVSPGTQNQLYVDVPSARPQDHADSKMGRSAWPPDGASTSLAQPVCWQADQSASSDSRTAPNRWSPCASTCRLCRLRTCRKAD